MPKSGKNKEPKCPFHPTRNRVVVVPTNLVPKSKLVIAPPSDAFRVYRVVEVGEGLPDNDGKMVPPKFQKGDLVVCVGDVNYYDFAQQQYCVVDPFYIAAKVEHDMVEPYKEGGKILTP